MWNAVIVSGQIALPHKFHDGLAGSTSVEPHVALREIASQLQEDRSKCNLKKADQLVDKIEELKNNASSLSSQPLETMREIVCSWRDSMEYALKDCNLGRMATGDMALCSWWYNPKVEIKLKAFLEEFKEVEDALAAIKLQPFRELGGKMAQAMNTITPTVKILHGLPDKLRDIADEANKNNVRPRADTESMKMSLKTDVNQSLRDLERCQTRLPELVDRTKSNYRKLSEFFGEAEGRIRETFSVPCPCCCMSGYAMDQPHVAVIELSQHTEKAKTSLDEFKQFADLLDGLQQTLIDLDVTKISAPVKKFSSLASQRLERLDKFVDEVSPARSQFASTELKSRFLLLPGKKPLLT